MRRQDCATCGQTRPFKRALGFGTLFAVLITGGLWLFAIPFYKLRCTSCGADYKPRRGEFVVRATMVLLALALAAPAFAQDKARVDLYDKHSNRRGYAIVDEKTGRVDTYDKESNRTGYGVVRPDGRVDRYRPDGERAGSAATSKPRR
jgi:hypothetical protein